MAIRGEQPRGGDSAMLPITLGCAALLFVLAGLGVAGFLVLARATSAVSAPAVAPVVVPVSVPPVLPPPTPEPPPEPPPEPEPEAEPASLGEIPGALSQDQIRRVVMRHVSAVRGCYEDALRSHPTMGPARVTAHFVIGGDGTVTSATADGSDDAVLTTCVATEVQRWVFPAPEGGGIVAVNYPFVLSTE